MSEDLLHTPLTTKKESRYIHATLCMETICGRGDSNPHGETHQILSLTRLPIPPRPLEITNDKIICCEISGKKKRGDFQKAKTKAPTGNPDWCFVIL